MKIAIDAMGGDYAPASIIAGAVNAVKEYDTNVILVGQESVITAELKKILPAGDPRITVQHAEQIINMDDIPSQIIRGKRNSSVHTGLKLVKDGIASAFYSAGNTGAVMAAAMLTLRTLDGINRPAIATVLPSVKKHFVMIDVGANVDSKPENYLHFAIMGSAYAKSVLHIESPEVGLLSIGEEDVKGNEITKTVFALLKKCKAINFTGNVEAKELFKGKADVIVCDGFVGNIALKTSESVAVFIAALLKQVLSKSIISKLGALLMLTGLKRFKKRVNPEEYGGAPLLGVGGICIIGHGSSSAFAVKNAVRVAIEMINHDINNSIETDVKNSFNLLKEVEKEI
ncbi:MAG: phosphate acyltransferase PlsX [Deferribacteraceae bacterium]|jgi:glycerol-3-phosphate acyltransferase PlsX|nr:phosphate acyltransferase PlsX [Deferribacteraceae bacterium]